MKKVIGIFGVVVIAMVMFFGLNANNGLNNNMDLANLISLSMANAESGATVTCTDIENPSGNFRVYRICTGCKWKNYTPTGNYGTCSF